MKGAGSERVVIVGTGLAGGTAAFALRERGFEGEVSMVGAELVLPYHRPPLSKTYLRGEEGFETVLLRPAEDYGRERIETRLGVSAAAVDVHARRVVLEDGEQLAYDRLLVATGGSNRRLPVPGADLDGVLQLRTVDQSNSIRKAAGAGRRAVVVGMGFIGSEVAASLRQLGTGVTVIEGSRAPLVRVLGEEVGSVLAGIHQEHGVDLVLEDSVSAIEGDGRVERVLTAKGRSIPCDLVVIGIGITPNTGLLERAGAAVNDGVLVDELCRTSLPDVYAAGDVTRHRHPVFGSIRVEHWNNADQQGRHVAAAMLGAVDPYAPIHSFWSDQYEHSIEYVGFAQSWDRLVFRGSLEERRFLGFYVQEGRLRAVVGLNRGGDPEAPEEGELKTCVPLIRAGVPVDVRDLEDEGTALGDLLAKGATRSS